MSVCFNSDNGKRKFRLFDINPIPFFTQYKSGRMVYTSVESDKSSNVLLKSKMYQEYYLFFSITSNIF